MTTAVTSGCLCTEFKSSICSIADYRSAHLLVLKYNTPSTLLPDPHQYSQIHSRSQWRHVCNHAGCLVRLPSGFAGSTTNGRDSRRKLETYLTRLADMCAEKGFRIAYKHWSSETRVIPNTWKAAWRIIKEMDRTNLGICLDTLQNLLLSWGQCRPSLGLPAIKSKPLTALSLPPMPLDTFDADTTLDGQKLMFDTYSTLLLRGTIYH